MDINIKQELTVNLPYNKAIILTGRDSTDKSRMKEFKLVVGFKGDQHDKANLGTVELSKEELYQLRDGINAMLGVK